MILVTGASGYLGRALVAALLARGERVRVLGRARSVPGAEVCRGDITVPATLAPALQGVGTVIHLAALVDHQASPAALARVNVQGSCNLAEAALAAGVCRFIHCSSVSAEPGGGSTAYGRSKIAAEQALAAYQPRLPIVTLRPGPIYDEERRNLQRLVRFARATRLCPRLAPDGLVHLASRRNVVEAFVRALAHGAPGRAYAVCDRAPVARSALAGLIAQRTGARALPLPMPLLQPALHAAALGAEALAALGLRSGLDRHYVRVLTRERRYEVGAAARDLDWQPAPTEAHFGDAVDAVLRAQRSS